MISDDDELQPQDDYADDTDGWNQEVRQRRERLFEEDDSDELKPTKRSNPEEEDRDPIDAEQDRQEKELRSIVDHDVIDFANETLSRRRQQNAGILPPSPPVITSDFSAFQSTPFRRDEEDKQIGRIKHSTPCPTATLVCDSVSASKSKCGFGEYTSPSTPPKKYLVQTEVWVNTSFVHNDSDPDNTDHCDATWNFTRTDTYDSNTCLKSVSCFGNTHQHHAVTGGLTPPPDCNGTYSSDGTNCILTPSNFTCTCTNNWGAPSTVTTQTTKETKSTRNESIGTDETAGGTLDDKYQLSNEYTTATLKSNVIAALPTYCGVYGSSGHGNPPCTHAGQGFSCNATANLSTDETSYTLQRVKYKIRLSTPACAGMIVTWNYHTEFSDGSHSNTAGPGFTASGGETEIGPFTIPDPSANGTTTVTNINVDCSGCTGSSKYQDVEFDQ